MISHPWRWWCSSIMRVPTNFDSVLFPVRLSFVGESHDPSRCQSAGMGPPAAVITSGNWRKTMPKGRDGARAGRPWNSFGFLARK